MDIILAAAVLIHLPDQVEQPRIHPGRLVPSPVAQKPTDLGKTLRIELSIPLVGNRRPLARMGKEQLQRPIFRRGK